MKLAEAADLEKQAREVLQRLLVYDLPDFLRGVDDQMALFDHLQPAFRGRFTGKALLQLSMGGEKAFGLGASTINSFKQLLIQAKEKEGSPTSSEKQDDDELTVVGSEQTES